MKKTIIYTDGASRGNPGNAGIGAVFLDDQGHETHKIAEYIGEATNNVAEYTALIKALEKAQKLGYKEVELFTDSELLVRQIKGVYKVKNEGLKPLYGQVIDLLKKFERYKIDHVRREKNKEADKLANLGIDQGLQEV